MKIEGKDFMTWLHDTRKKIHKEQNKKGMSNIEMIRKYRKDAENSLGKKLNGLSPKRNGKMIGEYLNIDSR